MPVTYRIISFDGGGIKGVVPAIILKRLQDTPGLKGFIEKADLFAGTSTGGLIALALANGNDPSVIKSLYLNDGSKIFSLSLRNEIFGLCQLTEAKYNNKNLTSILKNLFGNTQLKDLKKNVLITSFDLDNEAGETNTRNWKPKIFHNYPGPNNDSDQYAYKVGLYTSAAPTFFPSEDGYVDGGIYANNPSMCALTQVLEPRNDGTPDYLDGILLLSLGTGASLHYIPGDTHNWGYIQWLKQLLTIMMDGVNGIADYECKQLLHERYFRFAPVFPPSIDIPMDDARKLNYLESFASSVDLGEITDWLQKYWM